MSLIGNLASNPDVAVLVTAVVGAIGKAIWNKGKKSKEDDLWETLLRIGKQAFPILLKDKRLYDDAHVRETISKTIWSGLTRLSIPKNEIVMRLVDEAVEHIVGELAEKVMDYHLGRLEKPLKDTLDIIKALPEDKPIDTAAAPA
jgi:hypothetical protein